MTSALSADLAEPIAAIHSRAGAGGDLTLAPWIGGAFWQSRTDQPQPVKYTADVPAGLHVGAGLARLASHSDTLGGFDVDGPMVSVVRCTRPAPFSSSLGIGPAHACGIWIPPDRLDEASGSAVVALLRAFPQADGLWSSAALPARVALRLCAPLEPDMSSTALALARQARVLDLIAAALTWIADVRPASIAPAPGILDARRQIDQRLQTPPDLDTLAEFCGLSRRALTEGFRRAYGMSIGAYIQAQRLDLAVTLLASGLRVSEVAWRIGYAPAHFAAVYRRRFGHPPSRARR